MLTVLRSELRTRTGPVPFQDSLLSRATLGGQPIKAMHAQWPLMPLSIVYADQGKVRAMVLPQSTFFYPFDPHIPSALPHLERFNIDYSPYLAALPKTAPYELGQWIDFSENGNAVPYQTGGWWPPEAWGTWTTEQAALTFDLGGAAKSDLAMEVVAVAFLNEKKPAVDVHVLVNDVPAGEFSLRFKKGTPEFGTYRIVLSQKVLNKAYPAVIRFRVTGAASAAARVRVATRACSEWRCSAYVCYRSNREKRRRLAVLDIIRPPWAPRPFFAGGSIGSTARQTVCFRAGSFCGRSG